MRLKIQANPTTRYDGEPGYMVTAWSHHETPPKCVMSEWLTKGEAEEVVRGLTAEPPTVETTASAE